MTYAVTETHGTPPYTYSVIKTYRYRTLVGDVYTYSGLISTCYDVPAVPEIEATPEVTTTDPLHGWNSGARSVEVLVGDCYTQFTVPADALGVVCGLAPSRAGTDPRDVPHSFYVYQEAGRSFWCVSEAGVPKTTPRPRESEVFRIERRQEAVSYFVNGRRVYESAVTTGAPLLVVACMFAADDGVY